ncbi:MAG: hypothetical protein IPG56_15275 [Caulobacteraceae bacterium]|jgi:hypothetical protein|nr:hypothetical protein [Caulobacteraceae bacterium]
MTRRPPPAPNTSARPDDPTRRLILGAAATPLIPDAALAADLAAEACQVWLVHDAEHERLAVQWSRLEGRLHREHNWMKLTRAQRRRFPESRELDDLDDRIEVLSDENSALFKTLPGIVAASPLGICGKLTIAIKETKNDCEDVHGLIVSILRDYRALHGRA